MVNSLANKVMNILVPALPQMVKNHVSKIRPLAYGDGTPIGQRWNCKLVPNKLGLLGWDPSGTE